MSLRRGAFRSAVAAVVLLALLLVPNTARSATAVPIAVVGDSYTAGSDEGGNGERSWPQVAWRLLAREGVEVNATVAAEGGAGYGRRGNRGGLFQDLTARAVRHNDALVVFFGSRNDEQVDPQAFPALTADTFRLARQSAPGAKFLVIGPPWPTAAPPLAVLRIRDTLRAQAATAGALFVDPIEKGWFVGRQDLIGRDGVHPNDAGHEFMAVQIAALIYDQLSIRV